MNNPIAAAVAALLLTGTAGCGSKDRPADDPEASTTLTIGFGLATGQNIEAGIQGLARSIALEALVAFDRDGRPQARLAEGWTTSADGRILRLRLRPSVTFHDGTPVTPHIIRDVLASQLPDHLGPLYEDIAQIRVASDREIEFQLKRRSTLLLEGLDVLIGAPRAPLIGTGPFLAVSTADDLFEMRANDSYHQGVPRIRRVLIKAYGSVRAAWADMLRDQVDMLYEVGQDALDLLEPARDVEVFSYERPYAYIVMLNVSKPHLQSPEFRRSLNHAIDRQELVADVLKGHGTPADGAVWPHHWAYDSKIAGFGYQPLQANQVERRQFVCIFGDPSLERLALVLQKQLQAVGVDLRLEMLPFDQVLMRVQAGDYDGFLTDAGYAPTIMRPYLFWRSGASYNWSRFKSKQVDAALDSVRYAADEEAYKAGVAAFQRAVSDDPPAIFLAWSQRARAVSTRFEVPAEPGRDILSTLRLWRPVGDQRLASRN